jgi:hypothetical protein
LNFPSIDIQGSILSAGLPGKIRSEQATFQKGNDFYPDYNNARLKYEINWKSFLIGYRDSNRDNFPLYLPFRPSRLK